VVCRSKDEEVLGIHDLEVKNMVLLGIWLSKLVSEDGIWQALLRRKCVGSNPPSRDYWEPRDSHSSVVIMTTKNLFFPYGSFSIRNESEIRFWQGNG
jgi:hypothetical protein